ncbi:unnamed protein product [Dovyalis caffra]|uniref:Mitotic spindle assembly checkpoint protein MAD1 n=1 Tax=Dovyalis caffra TaxID=77055 RepID=A0AAV1ST32_9ROSI|nr:unnamed protein product [Dovyalis caffra]
MILRTPPAKRARGIADANARPIIESPQSDHHRQNHNLVIYEDDNNNTLPLQSDQPSSSEQLLCTYQCRQLVKSDFIDALSNAEKQVGDYQSKLEELNENFTNSEGERKKFRYRLLQVEQELAAAKGREQALQNQLLKEVSDNQERFKKQLDSQSKLEVKLENEKNLRQKAESSAASAEEKASVLEGKLSHLSESIEREKKRLNNELAQLNKESKHSTSRIRADLEKMECRANHAEKESELLKEQLEDLKRQLTECLHQRSELEKKLSSFTFPEVSSTNSNILIKNLQEELRNYHAFGMNNLGSLALLFWCKPTSPHDGFLGSRCTCSKFYGYIDNLWNDVYGIESEVREARKLRSSHENIELLKEKLLEEKGRRERAESELSKLLEFELNMKKLEDELSSWKSAIKDIPGVSCYDDIPAKFAALQKEVIDSMVKVGEANARLKQMEVALDTAQFGKQSAEAETALAKEKAEALKLEVKQIKLMVSISLAHLGREGADQIMKIKKVKILVPGKLSYSTNDGAVVKELQREFCEVLGYSCVLSTVTEEKDGLKNVINELKRLKNDQGGDEPANGVLLQEFESSLAKKEFCIQELENNLHAQKKVNSRQLEEIKTLNEMLNNEARRIKSMERETDRLRAEISLLESKLGHGDFSAANTKVLRMVNTLAVDNEAKQTIEALQTELQKTKEKLQAVEELKSQSGDAGKLVDSYISGKITQLKEQIATLEKREER